MILHKIMIRGPRQIGKSTLLKYTIFDLLKKGNRRSICYLPLDTTKDYTELRDNTAFGEYFETTMHEIPRFSLNEILEFGESEKLELDLLIPDIEKSFHEYLESGGIPSVIETVKKGGNFESLLDSGWDTMIGDVEKEGLSRLQNVGYWYSSDGKEIDFIVDGIPVELKYHNSINRSDLANVKKVFGKEIVLSKDTPDLSGDVKIIPSHLFWGII